MTWRDLAARLDSIEVRTFDETGITFQPMATGAPVGMPIPMPCEFNPAFVDQVVEDGMTVGISRIVADIHHGDWPAGSAVQADNSVALPDGRAIAPGCRLVVGAGPNVGIYVIDSIEPNTDRTGARFRLKRA